MADAQSAPIGMALLLMYGGRPNWAAMSYAQLRWSQLTAAPTVSALTQPSVELSSHLARPGDFLGRGFLREGCYDSEVRVPAGGAGAWKLLSMRRELSDDEWCKSFEYRPGTREYAECRQRIDRQRARSHSGHSERLSPKVAAEEAGAAEVQEAQAAERAEARLGPEQEQPERDRPAPAKLAVMRAK
jgi:hypothetical protein